MKCKTFNTKSIVPFKIAFLALLLMGIEQGCKGEAESALSQLEAPPTEVSQVAESQPTPSEPGATGLSQITTCQLPASCQNPAFSPDGTEMIFTKFLRGYNQGPSEIIRINLESRVELVVVPGGDFDHVNIPGSAWKEQKIAYASDESLSEREEIHTMDSTGKNNVQVTSHADTSLFIEPTFSKDGTRIVFEKSFCPLNDCEAFDLSRGSLFRVDGDGGNLQEILGDTGFDYRLPNWSPIGGRILFQKRRYPSNPTDEPLWDIWTMDENGTQLSNITASSSDDTDASWSWDGQSIVYSSNFGGLRHANIFIIPAKGGSPQRITQSDNFNESAPSFSPDGRSIAFEKHRTSDDESPSNIWWIPVTP